MPRKGGVYDEVNEALLSGEEDRSHSPLRERPRRTPLPMVQLSVLFFFSVAEPLTSSCIYPFINKFVSELDIIGGDEKKVGYYAGFIESLFFAAEALFVLHWSRVSDRIGRKPVLLVGIAGLCVSMVCFGLSRTYLGLVLSRCLVGALNGNLGVIKSMIAELTDETNMAQGYALLPVMWSLGSTIGPLAGGMLSRPHDHWPETFSAPFWLKYPYFLPCAVVSAVAAAIFLVTAMVLKETVKKPEPSSADPERFDSSRNDSSHHEDTQQQLPVRALLTYPILLSVASYAMLAILDIAYRAMQPLFLSTPIKLGGLGLTPASIGALLSAFGMLNGIFQALYFPRIIERFGVRLVYLVGICMFVVLYSMFPLINYAATVGSVNVVVWVLLVLQLAVSVAVDMAYGCTFMYIAAAAPNKQSLGATNGIAQLAASILRAIGPAMSTSLFAASVENNWLGGNAVYVFLVALSVLCFWVLRRLPTELWNKY